MASENETVAGIVREMRVYAKNSKVNGGEVDVMKDWTGNKHSTFVTLGASNHTSAEREPNDYYATHPKAAEMLCDEIELSHRIWECACGEGHLAKVFERRGHEVKATDLIFRGYGDGGVDFLSQLEVFDGDIVTNPPYKYATEFVKHALELVPNGRKVAMFLKITFLEGKRRYEMFRKTPPRWIYVSIARLPCAIGGDFGNMSGSAACYAWFVWEKGFQGEPTVRWFNRGG